MVLFEIVVVVMVMKLMVDDLPDEIDNEYIETEIVGLCASLLEITGQAAGGPLELCTVHLKHFSVKEYLLVHLPVPSWISANNQLNLSHEQMQKSLFGSLVQWDVCHQHSNGGLRPL